MSTNAITIGPGSPSTVTPRTSRIRSNTKEGPPCPECSCHNTIRKGKRRNRMRVLQVYQCSECLYRFTGGDAGKNKTYPLNAILETVSTFNRGHSVSETQALIRRRLHIHIPERTISSWIAEHRRLATYARLRPDAKKSFAPNQIVRSYTLEHRQVYRFQVHQAKLAVLTRVASTNIRGLENLKTYFDTVGPTYPHHLFTSTVERSSKFPADFPAADYQERKSCNAACGSCTADIPE